MTVYFTLLLAIAWIMFGMLTYGRIRAFWWWRYDCYPPLLLLLLVSLTGPLGFVIVFSDSYKSPCGFHFLSKRKPKPEILCYVCSTRADANRPYPRCRVCDNYTCDMDRVLGSLGFNHANQPTCLCQWCAGVMADNEYDEPVEDVEFE